MPLHEVYDDRKYWTVDHRKCAGTSCPSWTPLPPPPSFLPLCPTREAFTLNSPFYWVQPHLWDQFILLRWIFYPFLWNIIMLLIIYVGLLNIFAKSFLKQKLKTNILIQLLFPFVPYSIYILWIRWPLLPYLPRYFILLLYIKGPLCST